MRMETAAPHTTRGLPCVWILVLVFVLLAHCGHAPPEGGEGESTDIPVSFSYVDPEAKRVCVTGSFNQWAKEGHCMTREKDRWIATVRLPPGRWAYLFVIDDRLWLPDPDAPLYEDSGFDSKNSVVIVE